MQMLAAGYRGLFMDNTLKDLLKLNGKRTLLTGAMGGLGLGILDVFLDNNQHVTATTRQTDTKFNRS